MKFRYAEFGKTEHMAEFRCQSAANGQKRRPISAVERDGQNGSKGLINNQILDADAAVFEAKTQFSAVDSGISGGPDPGRRGAPSRDHHRHAETLFSMITSPTLS